MAAQIWCDDPGVTELAGAERLPPASVPGESVQGEHFGCSGRAEQVRVETAHVVHYAGCDVCRTRLVRFPV